jgi:hypothetical protein
MDHRNAILSTAAKSGPVVLVLLPSRIERAVLVAVMMTGAG